MICTGPAVAAGAQTGHYALVSAGATESELEAVEAALGVRLTADHRALLIEENGSEHWFGDVFLMIYGTADLVSVNREIERHPGFLAFASDGSRELIGLDLRSSPPPVVMIDITSAGWEDAHFQACSLADFIQQRRRGEELRWDEPYRPST